MERCNECVPNKVVHYTNPLHVYCRLRELHIKKENSKRLTRLYEKIIFPVIMKTMKTICNHCEVTGELNAINNEHPKSSRTL